MWNWHDNDCQYRSNIIVAKTKVLEDATNFALYLPMHQMPDAFWNQVKGDGGDLRVYDQHGNRVGIEVVAIDTSAKQAEVYTRCDLYGSPVGRQNQLYLYWGNPNGSQPARTAAGGLEDVWQHWDTVLHCQEDPTGTIVDSSARNDTITTTGTWVEADDRVAGAIPNSNGKGYDFVAADLRRIDVSGAFVDNQGDFSFMGFFKPRTVNNGVMFGTQGSTGATWKFSYNATSDYSLWSVHGGSSAGSSTNSYPDDTWRLSGLIYDGDDVASLRRVQSMDPTEDASVLTSTAALGSQPSVANTNGNIKIGTFGRHENYGEFAVDEFRYKDNWQMSSNYLRQCWRNFIAPHSFLSFQGIEHHPGSPLGPGIGRR